MYNRNPQHSIISKLNKRTGIFVLCRIYNILQHRAYTGNYIFSHRTLFCGGFGIDKSKNYKIILEKR